MTVNSLSDHQNVLTHCENTRHKFSIRPGLYTASATKQIWQNDDIIPDRIYKFQSSDSILANRIGCFVLN